jgi:uncharacterized membrane protein YkoI
MQGRSAVDAQVYKPGIFAMLKHFIAASSLLILVSGAAQGQSLSDVFFPTQPGGILPIETIVSEARAAVDGSITEVELERKRGAWVYEVEILSPDGRKTELVMDAQTGRILSRKNGR